MTTNSEISVAHQTDVARFVLTVDGQEAGFAEYFDTEQARDFNHTVVHEEFRGRGLSEPLIRAALDDARECGKKVIPSCSAAAGFIAKNEEYQTLVKQ